MNKIKNIILGFGLVALFGAAAYALGPVKPYVHSYSTTAGLVAAGGGAVYQVVLSTGASGEYVVLVDSGSATGVDVANATTQSKLLSSRLFYASTSASTVITFDPPIKFVNGLVIDGSAVTGQAAILYQKGDNINYTGR